MNDIKKIAVKFLFLGIFLLGLNQFYILTEYNSDLKEHSDVLLSLRAVEDSSEILYVGESSNITVKQDDIEKKSISEFIAGYFPNKQFGHITKPASHAAVYRKLLNQIPKSSPVETIIITLNLRSFNAQWIYSELETPLKKGMVMLNTCPPLFNRFLITFKAYEIKTREERTTQVVEKWKRDTLKFDSPRPYKNVLEWDDWQEKKGIFNKDGSKNWQLSALACNYIKTYAFQIDTLSNPRIHDFDKFIKTCRKRNWNLVFNLLAENLEDAQYLAGPDLVNMMEQNHQLLLDYFRSKNVIIVDNFDNVKTDYFIDKDFTTEHYSEEGRQIIAKNVADSLKSIYQDDYLDVIHLQKQQSRFFNDCEVRYNWGQKQTISDDFAYSGKYSSKTGNGEDYSITIEYPVNEIPDNCLKKVRIEFMLYQTSANHGARLMMESSGDNSGYYGDFISISDINKNINRWEKISYQFNIPEVVKNSDVVKIYLHNNSDEIIYIDDMLVVFE